MNPAAPVPPLLVGVPALIAVGASAGVGALFTFLMIRWTRARGILDVPNARSSHVRPTPRGGGVSIVVVVLFAELAAWAAGSIDSATAAALLIGAVIAAIGAWDDIRSIPAKMRLVIHLIAATMAVVALGTGIRAPIASAAVAVIAVLAIVWVTNLYNFMDGIDGIAGGQGIAAALAAAVVLAGAGASGLSLIAWSIVGATAGFLIFNWSPARIFMGDVGSGFLGFTFAALAWASQRTTSVSFVWIVLPLLPFVVDATITLVRRWVRGVRVTEAHREHLYQRAVQSGRSHARVAAWYGAAAVALGATAVWGARTQRDPYTAAALATLLTVALYTMADRHISRRDVRTHTPPGAQGVRASGSPGDDSAH